jgi:RHH-type transcriptional regulator, proline utilization regulon repressor / proline dehydrogenase / delta 1-pyrroline-5-carboxylate dehydrogenase
VQSDDTALDIARVIAAAQIAHLHLEVSSATELLNGVRGIIESDKRFIERVEKGEIKRVRLLKVPSKEIEIALANAACRINLAPVMTSGRLEILHYLREISWSFDYHRYGNLGAREQEKRRPLVDSDKPAHYEKEKNCGYSCQCE